MLLPVPNLPPCGSSQLLDLRVTSSTDVPFLLLNQPIISANETHQQKIAVGKVPGETEGSCKRA